MKKLLFGVFAIVALIATSCESNLEQGVKAGETSVVTLNVASPEVSTRLYSDGTTATHLQYAVYDAQQNILDSFTVTDGTINLQTQVTLQLTTGNTYYVLFWAAAPNAPYAVDLENKTMTVDYTGAKCNDENRDAFYCYKSFTVTGTMTVDVELKRPFAQLNVGTNDFATSTLAGYTVTNSKIVVPAYSTLDLATGAVSNQTTVTFDYNVIPAGESFPVDNYEYLAMTYVLMAADAENVEVSFSYYAVNDTDSKTRSIGSVPMQRNRRTNLYGTLLTSDVLFNVVIKPGYDNDDHNVVLQPM